MILSAPTTPTTPETRDKASINMAPVDMMVDDMAPVGVIWALGSRVAASVASLASLGFR